MQIALGLQFLQGQQTGQALSAFQKAIDADAGSAKAYMGRSLAYEASGEIEAASRDLRRYLAISGSQADPQMVKHLDELQFKHFSAIPSTTDPNEASPPSRVGIEILLRFVGIAVIAAIMLFAITQVLEFDRLMVSILVAVAGGGLVAAAIDTFLAQQARVNLSVPSPIVSLGMIPLLLLTGMRLDTETVNWDRFTGITSEVKAICEAPSRGSGQSSVSSFGKVWVHGDPNASDFDLDEAANLDDIDTLICVDESKDQLERCSYTNGGSITRYRRKWTVIVIDFETRNVIARNSFSGDSPDTCPGSISSSGNSDKNGSEPSRSEVTNWLNSLERG
jgi:hypothetical protein